MRLQISNFNGRGAEMETPLLSISRPALPGGGADRSHGPRALQRSHKSITEHGGGTGKGMNKAYMGGGTRLGWS